MGWACHTASPIRRSELFATREDSVDSAFFRICILTPERRLYVAALSTAIFAVFLVALSHPYNRSALVTFATTLFWFTSMGYRSRWEPTVDLPRSASELNSNDIVLFRSYRILTWIWILTAIVLGGFCTERAYQDQTWWHAPCGVGILGVAVLSVNLPKAMLIWNTPD